MKKEKRGRTNETMQRRRQKTRGDKQEDFSFKKGEEEKRKIKVRQKRKSFKKKQQKPSFSKKNAKRKKEQFSQREETSFSPNNLTKWNE